MTNEQVAREFTVASDFRAHRYVWIYRDQQYGIPIPPHVDEIPRMAQERPRGWLRHVILNAVTDEWLTPAEIQQRCGHGAGLDYVRAVCWQVATAGLLEKRKDAGMPMRYRRPKNTEV